MEMGILKSNGLLKHQYYSILENLTNSKVSFLFAVITLGKKALENISKQFSNNKVKLLQLHKNEVKKSFDGGILHVRIIKLLNL